MATQNGNNNNKDPKNNNGLSKAFKYAALPISLGLLISLAVAGGDGAPPAEKAESITYSELIKGVKEDRINDVKVIEAKNIVTGTFEDTGKAFTAKVPAGADVATVLIANDTDGDIKVDVDNKKPADNSWVGSLLIMGIMIGFMIYFLRKIMGAQSGLGKTKSKEVRDDQKKVTFDDVAGVDEAKQDLQEVVDFLQKPGDAGRLGAKMPKGALLVGPPGTGKTLLARAVAGEAGVSFIQASGSDFVEMFVGRGAARVRSLFEEARKKAPCVVFIDEIDAVAGRRSAGVGGGGHEEREQTLNAILVEMDGFDSHKGIFVLAATNRADILDPALMRPGRFDRQVTVPLPDIGGREKILRVHMRGVHLAKDVDVKEIARATPGFSGADIENLVNTATIKATNEKKDAVDINDFREAIDRIIMGAPRQSMIMTQDDKELTAYHEAGHALVGLHMPGCDPLHKVTIIPRGRALGVTINLPERDRWNYSRQEIIGRLAMMYGGRAAEEIIRGKDHATTGAGNDIQQATNMARRMVMEWGLSDKLGPILYGEEQYGRPAKSPSISDKTAQLVDEEVQKILTEAHQKATDLLTQNRPQLDKLAQALLDQETLTGAEVHDLLGMNKNGAGASCDPQKPKKKSTKKTGKKSNPRDKGGSPAPS